VKTDVLFTFLKIKKKVELVLCIRIKRL